MARFEWFELRTTDVAAARGFYAAVLGLDGLAIGSLPGDAAARGAPAHWLGHLGVPDPEAAALAFVARGAIRLGPIRPGPDGRPVAVVRDPGGAVVGLSAPPEAPARLEVAWHQLHTADLEHGCGGYHALFGWSLTERHDLGPFGVHQQFAWSAGGASVGSMVQTASLAGTHPHWLFHFRVASLERVLPQIRAAGGTVVGPFALAGGQRVAVCEDPQGAAFALRAGG
jgi:predicted enzyme related to lactoylglutathione lyase